MPTATAASVGPLLRDWRQRRRLSQLDLALEAGVSARHVSFVETGRARPSAEMVLHLAEHLDVPLRDRNRLLLAAGYAPRFAQHAIDDPELAPVREALQLVLDGHDPYPAAVVDREWELVVGNAGLALLLEGVDPALLQPPVNVLRLALHPEGIAPRVVNFGEWRGHVLDRLAKQVATTADERLAALYDELAGYPGPAHEHDTTDPVHDVVTPLKIRTDDGVLSFFSTIATFGTATDVTVAELAIESFFPADAHTRDVVLGRAR